MCEEAKKTQWFKDYIILTNRGSSNAKQWGKAKSLKNFIQDYKSEKSVRTSLADYKINDNNLYDIPLYAIGNIEAIVE